MRVERLVVASHNPDKIAEIEAVLSETGAEIVRDLNWPEIEENGSTLEENALLKAGAVWRATGLPALADDTGLFVTALGGLPGVHTARFAGPEATYSQNVALLLEKLSGIDEREAVFRTVVAVVSEAGELVAEGQLAGRISHERRGESGFGYDPIFELESGQTLAELDSLEKNLISHRAQALRNLARSLSI